MIFTQIIICGLRLIYNVCIDSTNAGVAQMNIVCVYFDDDHQKVLRFENAEEASRTAAMAKIGKTCNPHRKIGMFSVISAQAKMLNDKLILGLFNTMDDERRNDVFAKVF